MSRIHPHGFDCDLRMAMKIEVDGHQEEAISQDKYLI